MDPTQTRALHARAAAAIASRRGDAAAHIGELDVQRYLCPERARKESALMRRTPQPVAASAELPAPGSWVSRRRFDTPFLLVRQADGTVHAFLNVCRHRGAIVVPEGAGSQARAFVCPYHAWTYQPDGQLRGLPQAHGFPCLDRAASGLRRLAATERAGLVWVVADPALADADADAHLGPLMDELEAFDGLAAPVAFAPRSYTVAANWKLLLDGGFEAYHFKVAHQATVAPMFEDNLQIIDEAGPHRRLFLVKANFAREQPAADGFEPRRYGNLAYFFFPNASILVQPDHAQLSCLEPLGPDRTQVHEITLIPQAPATEKARAHWQANVELYRRTLTEDYVLSESIQSGLTSGANQTLRFGTFEFSAPRFHQQLDERLAREGATAQPALAASS